MKAMKCDAMTSNDRSNDSVVTTVLSVKGMDCADCAAPIEQAVASMPGVKETEVDFTACCRQRALEHDHERVDRGDEQIRDRDRVPGVESNLGTLPIPPGAPRTRQQR